MRTYLTVVAISLAACAKADPPPASTSAPPAPSSAPVAGDAPTPAAPTPTPEAAPPGAPSLPPAWVSCTRDSECTFVSLGCCDTTPVNRAHAKEARERLDASGRPYCAPKSACGPGADGTWSGTPGTCRGGVCIWLER